MISSIAGNRPAVQQTDYSQKPPAASTTNSDHDVQKDPTLKTGASTSTGDKKTGEISESDLKVISELRQRDAEVRTHEAAHLAAAGSIATGGASFEYQQGPTEFSMQLAAKSASIPLRFQATRPQHYAKPTPSEEPPCLRPNLPVPICKLQPVQWQWPHRHTNLP